MVRNITVAAAVAAVLASGAAMAQGQPTPAQAAAPTVGLYVSGSSAAKNAILGALETGSSFCAGTYSLFSSTGDTNFFAVSCEPTAATGLPSAQRLQCVHDLVSRRGRFGDGRSAAGLRLANQPALPRRCHRLGRQLHRCGGRLQRHQRHRRLVQRRRVQGARADGHHGRRAGCARGQQLPVRLQGLGVRPCHGRAARGPQPDADFRSGVRRVREHQQQRLQLG